MTEPTTHERRPRIGRPDLRRTSIEVGAVVGLSLLMVAVVFEGEFNRLRAALGYGDLLQAYSMSSMWANGSPFGDNSLGYPAGMHLPYFPTGDLAPNLLAAFFSNFTSDPFLPLNLVFVASFPATAVASLWLLRIVGVRGPMAVIGALGLTAIPYHWLRVEHVYLATMYAAVLGVALALLVGSGGLDRAWQKRRLPLLIATAIAVLLIGTGGIYYACFAILLVGLALVYRAFRGDRWKSILLSGIPAVAVTVVLGAVLLPGMLWARANPALGAVAERAPVESVEYTGALALAMLPAPFSDLPGVGLLTRFVESAYEQGSIIDTSGVLWAANSGSFFTLILLMFLLVGSLVLARRRARALPEAPIATRVSLSLVLTLLGGALLFFIPWGLNYLFALTVTSQLRGWDRLIPVLFALLLAGAATVWRDLSSRWRTRTSWIVAAALTVVVALDSVTPYRLVFAEWSEFGMSERNAGLVYAQELNAEIPETCGVLQLPYVQYPEVPSVEALGNYAHLLPALTNPDKLWSFGAVKETPDSALPAEVGNDLNPAEVSELKDRGFCAVHVDWRGFAEADRPALLAALESDFGAPVASGHDGDWTAYKIG